jgi:hypothetical protein
LGFIDKAKALIGKHDGDGSPEGDHVVRDTAEDDSSGQRAQTSDELLDKAKAAIDKLLE